MLENIFDVAHEAIDATEKGVHTGSNAVHGVNNYFEDQTGQHNFDWESALEYCVDEKNPIECIRDNLMKTVNEGNNWNSVLENCNDPKNTVYYLEYCFDQKKLQIASGKFLTALTRKLRIFHKIYHKACVGTR